ncbi:MAG: carboxypeptidase-like regulatory domain-containing protein, partial [Bacteroidota bacterium]
MHPLSKNRWALTLIALLISTLTWAQNGSITGKIVDAEDGTSLIGANALIEETKKGASTDLDGNFTISGLSAGDYTLKITFVGFEELTMAVSVSDGNTDVGTIQLAAASILTDAVVISGSRRAEKVTETAATIGVLVKNAIAELP